MPQDKLLQRYLALDLYRISAIPASYAHYSMHLNKHKKAAWLITRQPPIASSRPSSSAGASCCKGASALDHNASMQSSTGIDAVKPEAKRLSGCTPP